MVGWNQRNKTENKQVVLPHRKPTCLPGSLSWIPILVVWIFIWQCAYWVVGKDLLLASPLQVIRTLFREAVQLEFWLTTAYSILRIQAGFILGIIIGSLLAVLTVRIIWLDRFFHPLISTIRATPIASFIILALVWMTHDRVVVFIVFLMVLPIVWGNVSEGIRKTDNQLLEMAKVFRLRKRELIRAVYLPSIAPFFTVAATTSLGLGWKAGIAAEVLSRPSFSLGGRLYDSKIYLETSELLAYTAVVIVLSILLERLLQILFRWTERYFRMQWMTHGKTGD